MSVTDHTEGQVYAAGPWDQEGKGSVFLVGHIGFEFVFACSVVDDDIVALAVLLHQAHGQAEGGILCGNGQLRIIRRDFRAGPAHGQCTVLIVFLFDDIVDVLFKFRDGISVLVFRDMIVFIWLHSPGCDQDVCYGFHVRYKDRGQAGDGLLDDDIHRRFSACRCVFAILRSVAFKRFIRFVVFCFCPGIDRNFLSDHQTRTGRGQVSPDTDRRMAGSAAVCSHIDAVFRGHVAADVHNGITVQVFELPVIIIKPGFNGNSGSALRVHIPCNIDIDLAAVIADRHAVPVISVLVCSFPDRSVPVSDAGNAEIAVDCDRGGPGCVGCRNPVRVVVIDVGGTIPVVHIHIVFRALYGHAAVDLDIKVPAVVVRLDTRISGCNRSGRYIGIVCRLCGD